MGAEAWSYHRIQVTAVVGGVAMPVTRFEAAFALNTIPTARLFIPLGRDVIDGTPAPPHVQGLLLAELTPVTVTARFVRQRSGAAIPTLGLPDRADLVLFDGFVHFRGFVRGRRRAALVLGCLHKLGELDQSSALSDSSHPGNPARYSFGALQGGDSGARSVTALTVAQDQVTASRVARDLWGAALYRWLQSLTEQDGLWVVERNVQIPGGNDRAAEALARLAPGREGYVASTPRADLEVDEDLAGRIAEDVGRSTLTPDVVAQQTLWGVLVGAFIRDYLLAVVPRVSDGLVVPFVPGLAGPVYRTLSPDVLDQIDLGGAAIRPLRAVGVLAGTRSFAGAATLPETIPGLGGWYDTGKEGGQILFGQAPRWLSAARLVAGDAPATVGAGGVVVASAFEPLAADPDAAAGEARRRERLKTALDLFAEARYVQEVTQGRQGTASGPFRVDLAPGSLVALDVPGERWTQATTTDALATRYTAHVAEVSLALDAGARPPQAATVLRLSHLRAADEEDEPGFTVPGHPVYTHSFRGASLVPESLEAAGGDDGASPGEES